MENQLQLVASLIEREATRYTPAGIPVIVARLLHQSQQTEAEAQRSVEFEMPVIAIGKIAGQLEKLEAGQLRHFTGYLAKRNRKSRTLVLHITGIASLSD